jgi:hypothetical protein
MPLPPTVEHEYDIENWDAVVAQRDPAGPQVFTENQQSAALIAHLHSPLEKHSFLRQVRGYAYADSGSPWRLRRVNPIRHPEYPHLVANRVAFVDSGLAGNPENEKQQPYRESPEESLLVRKHGYYCTSLATVDFAAVPYPIVEDDDFNEFWYVYEYQRNVDFQHQYTAETNIISAETGRSMAFVEGPPDTTPKTTFPSELPEYIQKATLQWKWYNVPHEYIFDQFDYPKKLVEGLGRVNAEDFGGWDRMTLLYNSFQLEKFLYPWLWDDGAKLPAYGYNVTFVMSHFDPLSGVENPFYRGHNLLPWVKAPAINGSIWFSARRPNRNGDLGVGGPLIPTYDFDKLFEHVRQP